MREALELARAVVDGRELDPAEQRVLAIELIRLDEAEVSAHATIAAVCVANTELGVALVERLTKERS